MTITIKSETLHNLMGWCPMAPTTRTASTVLVSPAMSVQQVERDEGTGGSGRIVRGIKLATGSIKTLFRNKQLLWFSFLTGLVMLFMIAAELFYITNIEMFLPFFVSIPLIDSFGAFDTRFFLVQIIGVFCINLLLAGLILSIAKGSSGQPLPLREGFSKAKKHAGSLIVWSAIMAFLGTVIYTYLMQDHFFGSLRMIVGMSAFFIPYVYYIPDAIGAALYFVFYAMLINVMLFIFSLFVVPVMVLENKSLLGAIAGSIVLFKKTWVEIIGCFLFFGPIALGISFISIIICMTPVLVNHDYDFFLSRGRLLMTTICFLYIVGWWILMTIGSTTVGISLNGLYTYAKTGRTLDGFEES